MERRDEHDLDRLLGEIPIVTSSSPLQNYHHLLLRRTINPSETITPNPMFLQNLYDQETLETAFSHLNLSTLLSPPPPALDRVIGKPFLGNPVNDPSIGQVFPTMSLQQLQQTAMIQNDIIEMMAACILDHGSVPVAPQGFEGFGLPRSNPATFINDACHKFLNGVGVTAMDGCWKSCCVHHLKNECFLQLPKLSSPEFHKQRPLRSFSHGNGVVLDSEGHCRGGVDGPVLKLDYSNLSRSPSYNRLHQLQQHPKYSSLEEVRGQIVAMAKDQHGCRFLQNKFEEPKKEEIEMIFMEIKDYISELMVDQFGNYLVQKLLEVCSEKQRTEVLLSVTRNEFEFVAICLDMHGTRVVQKLLEQLTTPQQISRVMLALRPGTVILTKDMNGHHVIRHCLKHFSNEDNRYLLNAVADHCVEIARDRSGCCVLQQCVEHAQGEPKERLVAEINANALTLAQDPYGNYVVQYIVGMKIPHITADLLRQLEGSFVQLSMQKFSSNVVERCLKESGEEQSTRIIRELLSSPNLLTLFQDAYGNYVIQSALMISKGPVYNAIVDLVRLHSQSLRSHPYGKRIISRITRRQ